MGISILIGSLAIYFIYVWIADQIYSFKVYQVAISVFKTPIFYLTMFLCLGLLFILDLSSFVLSHELTDNLVYYFKYLIRIEKISKEEYFEEAVNRQRQRKKSRRGNFFENLLKSKQTKICNSVMSSSTTKIRQKKKIFFDESIDIFFNFENFPSSL